MLGDASEIRNSQVMEQTPRKRLPMPRVLAFASLSLPIAGVGLPVAVYIAPLYAEDIGLGLGLTGFLFMIMRLWDMITDPIMGFMIDRFKSPLGRVKHWIVLSVPLLGLGTYFAYMPPREGVTAWYFVIWMTIFYVGFTLVQTSRSAWVPAIAADYDDRSRYFLWNEIIGYAFMLLLLAVPLILSEMGIETDRIGAVRVMGWLMLIGLPVAAFLALTFVPDPPIRGHSGDAAQMNWSALKTAFGNPFLGRIIVMELLIGTAIAVTASNFLFVFDAAFGVSGAEASAILFGFLFMSLVGMPVIMRLTEGRQKHHVFALAVVAMAVNYLTYLVAYLIQSHALMIFAAIINGFLFGVPIVLIRAMLADVVEYEVARSSENRAGIYYSLLTGFQKLGSSLAVGVGYLLVEQVARFDPRQQNSDEAVLGLVLIFCLLPMILFLLSGWLSWSYRLTREVQAETAAHLDTTQG